MVRAHVSSLSSDPPRSPPLPPRCARIAACTGWPMARAPTSSTLRRACPTTTPPPASTAGHWPAWPPCRWPSQRPRAARCVAALLCCGMHAYAAVRLCSSAAMPNCKQANITQTPISLTHIPNHPFCLLASATPPRNSRSRLDLLHFIPCPLSFLLPQPGRQEERAEGFGRHLAGRLRSAGLQRPRAQGKGRSRKGAQGVGMVGKGVQVQVQLNCFGGGRPCTLHLSQEWVPRLPNNCNMACCPAAARAIL